MSTSSHPGGIQPAGDDRSETVFFAALKQVPEERSSFLATECRGNSSLREKVEELLRDHEKAGGFLQGGASLSIELSEELIRLRPEECGDRIGPYKLVEQVGEGGFGRVWVAEQERPIRRRVALKIIKLGMDTKEVIARFEQERQALAMMEHPNIAQVLEAGSTPLGRPYFAMELVKGVRITDYCDEAQLSTEQRLRLFIQVCSAVQHAHQKGIIHRDLKPSNLLVTLHDGVPVPKVIDFGVAKAIQQQRLTDLTIFTHVEQMIGTPLYMPPEQAEFGGSDVDTRSDIYSLGVLLYELLTGRTPFDPELLMKAGLDEVRRVIREQEPQKPSTFVSTMPMAAQSTVASHRQTEPAKLISSIRGDLDWIVMKALEKDRNRRYETAHDLAKDIERHLLHEPVLARPPTASYRLKRAVRRNIGAFAAAAVIVALLLLGSAVSTWQAIRANHEADRAHSESQRATLALDRLRSSAPAFLVMARDLAAKDRPEEAMQQLNYAITLRPDVLEYTLAKADFLESQLRFADAAPVYRQARRLAPADSRALLHEKICEELAQSPTSLPHQSLAKLLEAMRSEGRSAAEMMRVARALGAENQLLLDYWREQLKDLPIATGRTLKERLTVADSGLLELDLSDTQIADLAPLNGMPLEKLLLVRCPKVADLKPVKDLPLITLKCDGDALLKSISPLASVKTLRSLSLASCSVYDLTPLHGSMLVSLDLRNGVAADMSPLNGVPLESLVIANCPIDDLFPLVGMPLRDLECSGIRATDFSPLAALPLEQLSMQITLADDLAFLRNLPLRRLYLSGSDAVTGFQVLNGISSLEVLVLPDFYPDWPEDEIQGIDGLRYHPNLQQIQLGLGVAGSARVNVTPKEAFWKRWDHLILSRHCEIAARHGDYSKAEILSRELMKDSRIDDPWVGLGAILVHQGERERYRAFCHEVLEQYKVQTAAKTPALPTILSVMRICLLSSDSDVPASAFEGLMEGRTVTKANQAFLRFRILSEGLRLYRLGRLQDAAEMLQLASSENPLSRSSAAATVIRAMANYRLGQTDTAESDLSRARAVIDENWPGEKINLNWHDWLVAHLLLEEADKLFATP